MRTLYTILFLSIFPFSIILNAQTPNFLWAKQMGGATTDRGYSIAVDADGNVYTTGTFTGTADFNPSNDPNTGTYNLTAVGNYDIFISKLDASGNFLWAKNFGGTAADYGYSITLDATGNVYTTGYFEGLADFDPGVGVFNLTSFGNEDVFVSKLNASGNFIWAKRLGGASHDIGYSIAVNSIGNVSTTGYFRNTADFNPGTGTYNLIATGNTTDIFVSTLDASGNFLWAKQLGGPLDDEGYSIAVDANGDVYTTGYFKNTGDFDPGNGVYNLISNGNYDVFISKLDASGNFVWAKQFGGLASNSGTAIAVDENENVFTTGSFNGTTDFNPSPFGTFNLFGSQGDAFVSKLDVNGDFVWAKQLGGSFPDVGTSIDLDANGDVYTTGIFWKAGDFDPGSESYIMTAVGNTNYDIYISKLDSLGEFLWAMQMGGLSEDNSYDMAVDTNGNIYTTGSFYFTADFDPGNETYNLTTDNNYEDIFVVKLCQIAIPTITGPTSFCQGGSITLTSSPEYSYLWSNGATTQSITVSSSGNYSVTVSNSSGCAAASGVTTVISNPLPNVTVNNATICSGQSATLAASGAISYQWSNGMTGNSITVNPTNDTSYTVVGTSAVGCNSLPATAQVTVNPSPTVTVDSATICLGQSATLTASGATTYQWSNGMTGISITVNPANNTSYTVTGTTNGCSDTATVSISVTPLPIVTATIDTDTICIGSSTVLHALGADTYSWSPITGLSDPNSPNPFAFPDTTTIYSVIGTKNNCSNIDTVSVVLTVLEGPPATPGPINGPATVCSGDLNSYFIPIVSGVPSYSWALPIGWTGIPSGNSILTTAGPSSGYITVAAANVCGNSIPDSLLVTVNLTPDKPTIMQNGYTLTSSALTGNQWYRNDTLIVGATGQTYTATISASYSLIVTIDGCSSEPSVPVIIVGVSHTNTVILLNIFPNPTNGMLTVSGIGFLNDHYSFSISNSFGQILKEIEVHPVNGEIDLKIDLKDYLHGMYFLTVKSGGQSYTFKVLRF